MRSSSITGQSARPICWSTSLQHSCQIMSTRFFCSAKGASLVVLRLKQAAGCRHALDDNRLECSAELSGFRLLNHQLFYSCSFPSKGYTTRTWPRQTISDYEVL